MNPGGVGGRCELHEVVSARVLARRCGAQLLGRFGASRGRVECNGGKLDQVGLFVQLHHDALLCEPARLVFGHRDPELVAGLVEDPDPPREVCELLPAPDGIEYQGGLGAAHGL